MNSTTNSTMNSTMNSTANSTGYCDLQFSENSDISGVGVSSIVINGMLTYEGLLVHLRSIVPWTGCSAPFKCRYGAIALGIFNSYNCIIGYSYYHLPFSTRKPNVVVSLSSRSRSKCHTIGTGTRDNSGKLHTMSREYILHKKRLNFHLDQWTSHCRQQCLFVLQFVLVCGHVLLFTRKYHRSCRRMSRLYDGNGNASGYEFD